MNRNHEFLELTFESVAFTPSRIITVHYSQVYFINGQVRILGLMDLGYAKETIPEVREMLGKICDGWMTMDGRIETKP